MGGFLSFLKRQRWLVEENLARKRKSHTFSLARYLLHKRLALLIKTYVEGVCLDAGSGHSPFKESLTALATRVVTVDSENRSGEVDLIADIQNMPSIADASMDTVLCSQVLEHVPRPCDAISEMYRVLKDNGHVILSVPHLSPIHEAPHDYFRYTEYGLNSLLTSHGFRVLELHPAGGLLSFLAHPATSLTVSLFASVPGLRTLAWFCNYVLLVRLLEPVDRVFGMLSVFPVNYVVVARKISHA